MGFDLGGLTSITKMFDAGNLVKQAVNSVLPKNMAVVGDAAGAIFDLKTGNVFGAAQLAMDGLKDLPQAAKSQQQQAQQTNGGTARGAPVPTNAAMEPSPPPATAKPLDLGKLTELFNQILAMFGKKPDSPPASTETKTTEKQSSWATESIGNAVKAVEDAVADASAKATTGTKTTWSNMDEAGMARVAARSSNTDKSATTTTTTTTRTTTESSGWGEPRRATESSEWRGEPPRTTTESSGWRGEPRTPPPAAPTTSSASTPATSSTPAASATSTPAPPATSPPAASSAPAASPSAADVGQTISSMAQMNSMSDSAIRDAVIHGRISPELAKDQTAMMAIQQRMNAISEMNNLMTNMMKALHDMQMAVVQNIRI